MEALIIPWALLVLVLVIVVCLIKKWWKASAFVFFALLLVNWYWSVFSFGFRPLDEQKSVNRLRVMTWNISCADTTGTSDVAGLISTIQEQDADVVFVTEYSRHAKPEIDSLLSKTYPYKDDYPVWVMWGQLYSFVPIDSCVRIGGEEEGYLFRFDVHLSDMKLPIYCLHLQSNNMVNGQQFYPDSIQGRGGVSRYLDNYRLASEIRREQAELIVRDLSNEPCIVMGDMNDVCGSPGMKAFNNSGLRDAWWEGGFGYGATIHEPLPYRIDHIMYSDGLRLKGIKKVNANGLSDHDALVADFEIR